jgi:hypothetical protein
VQELWFFLLGCAATLVAVFVARRLRVVAAARPAVPGAPAPAADLAEANVACSEPEPDPLATVAISVGKEIADLASGIEGHAQMLCEAVGEPERVVTHAGDLWRSVRRLRLFSEKILTYAQPPSPLLAPTDVTQFLDSLRHEVEDHLGGGIPVEVRAGHALPFALAEPGSLRNAILFLVDAMLGLERNAGALTLSASTSTNDDEEATVEIELVVESDSTAEPRAPMDQRVQLGYLAARSLLDGLRGHLSLERIAGVGTTCLITLAATSMPPGLEPDASEAPPDQDPPQFYGPHEPHPFGGVLILEGDRLIRSMLCHELERSGRKLFTCTDGVSARVLFERTPERFELLILEEDARHEPAARLARLALTSSYDAKVILVTHAPGSSDLPREFPGRCTEVRRPFGLLELREALTSLVGESSRPTASVGRV